MTLIPTSSSGGGLVIGAEVVDSAVSGGVLYVDAGGNLAEHAQLAWDGQTLRVGTGADTFGTQPYLRPAIYVRLSAADGRTIQEPLITVINDAADNTSDYLGWEFGVGLGGNQPVGWPYAAVVRKDGTRDYIMRIVRGGASRPYIRHDVDMLLLGSNVGLGDVQFGGGTNCLFLGNGTAPTSNPVGGVLIYSQGNVVKIRKPDGSEVSLNP